MLNFRGAIFQISSFVVLAISSFKPSMGLLSKILEPLKSHNFTIEIHHVQFYYGLFDFETHYIY